MRTNAVATRAFVLLAAAAARAQDASVYTPVIEPASTEAELAIGAFEVAAGFEVELFAAEPSIANPVCFYPGRAGEFYVAETFRLHAGVTDVREHMDWLDDDVSLKSVEERVAMFRRHEGERFAEYAREHERVRLVRDTDGDGVADLALVFADGFSEPADGIGAGLLARGSDVYYTCIPHVWLLRDADGDGRAEERRALSSGYGIHVALLGHDLHGLRIGPEGKLYFSCGDRGFRVETERGLLDHAFAGAVLRCNLDGTELEVFASGLRNPQELAFDEWGNLFTCDNNSDGGDRARVVHVVEGGDSGWRYAYQWLTAPNLRGPWNEEKLWHPHFAGQAAYVVPPIANFADGPSGFTHDPGTGVPSAHAGRFFLCDFRGDARHSGIHSIELLARGAGFELGKTERLVWGTLATDCDFAPDGALYFTDWVHGWNKTGKGRLYRLVPKEGASAFDETRRVLAQGFAAHDATELARLLDHADQRVRQGAQLELVARGESGRRALDLARRNASTLLGRVHAIWGLGAMLARERRTGDELYGELASAEPEVRAQTARVLGELRDKNAATLLQARLVDASPRVVLFAALALARLGLEDSVPAFARLARVVGEPEPMLRHAAILGLANAATAEELAELASDPSPDVRVAAVVALRRRTSAGATAFLRDSDPRVVLEAARAIYDAPIEAGLEALAREIDEPELAEPALARRVLAANFRLGGESRARALARFASRAVPSEALRREALDLLARWKTPPGRDPFHGAWWPIGAREADFLPAIVRELGERSIDAAPPAVVAAWIRLCASADARDQSARLSAWCVDRARAPAIRAEALRTLAIFAPDGLKSTLDELFLDPEGEVRAAALSAYEKIAPDEVLPILERALAQGELVEQRAAYQALATVGAMGTEARVCLELDDLDADLVADELALDLVLAAEKRGEPSVRQRLERHRARRAADEVLAKCLDGLAGGDAARGEALFREKAETYCLRCHKVDDAAGSDVGPDLRGVSRRLSRFTILESIVAPERRIAQGYEATSFFLVDGTHVGGRVLAEDAELVRVQKDDGSVVEIAADEIELRKPALSAMPQGFGEHLSRTEMRDLIEYLGRL